MTNCIFNFGSQLIVNIATIIITLVGFWIAFNYKIKEIKFSRLHEERAIILKEIYKLIVRLNLHLTEYIKPHNVLADTEYNYEGLAKTYNSFIKEYIENKVFIPDDLIIKIEKLKNYCSPIIDCYFGYEQYVKTNGVRGKQPDNDKMDQMAKNIKNDLPLIIKSIEEKFKKIFK